MSGGKILGSHGHAYGALSFADKRARDLASVRESAVTCPSCDTQVMPADLLAHLEQRCTGPREPGPGAKWLTWREALAFGVAKKTLARWANAGHIRFKGEHGDRLYLARDLAVRIAQREASRRRQCHK